MRGDTAVKHVFKLQDAYRFEWPGLKGYSYSESTDFERASAARFEVTERHGRVFNDISDRIYLVLGGEGWFEINGNRHYVVATDVVIVPRQTEYDYGGRMTLFLVHTPAYRPETDHDLEGLQS